MKQEKNYLDSVYDIIYANDVVDDDNGVEIIDDEEYEGYVDYEPEWGEDVDIIDEDYNEDECYLEELGDGFIPLPVGDVEEVDVICIDENYIPDEYEADVCGGNIQEDIEIIDVKPVEESKHKIVVDASIDVYKELTKGKDQSDFDKELERLHEATTDDSVIKTPQEVETLSDSMGVPSDDPEKDRIAKAIAKEYMEKVQTASVSLPGAEDPDAVDASWIENDLYGNDINSIVIDVPDETTVEDTDYIEGSFRDWANDNGVVL